MTALPALRAPRPATLSAAQPRARLLREGLLLAPFLFLIGLTFFLAQTDPDYWWHARTGQLILATGQLPRADPFSFTSLGQPWVTHEWLSEVVFAALVNQWGYVANVALCAILGALTALGVYATCRLRGLGPQVATLLTLWAYAIILPLANVRPQMVTIALLAVVALILTAYRGGARRPLWLLPPLFVPWVNLHGGYVIGLVLLGLAVVGELLAARLGDDALPRRPLILVSVLSGLATLVSPLGLEALRYPFTYAGTGNASQRFIAEWQSPDFHSAAFYPLAASLLVGLLVGVGGRRARPTELLWTLTFGAMALQSMRHGSLYGIVVLPLLGSRLAALAPAWPAFVARWRGPLRLILPLGGWLVAVVALLAVAAPGGNLPLQTGQVPRADGYPAGAVAFLRDRPEVRGNLFNSYTWGGYLIAELYPDRLVSADGRADVHGDALVTRHRDVERLAPGWRDTLADWQVGIVLVGRDSPLAVALRDDPAWQERYSGEVERLFVRR